MLEGEALLVDWGVKSVAGDKNTRCLAKVVEEMIVHYNPDVMVLEDCCGNDSRRSSRIRNLSRRTITLGQRRQVAVKLISCDQIERAFSEGEGTKHARAESIARQFPAELGLRLPPKRRPWMSEDYRMDIFAAVALAMTFQGNRPISTK